MKIAIVREQADGERRVAATPETVKKFGALGADVAISAQPPAVSAGTARSWRSEPTAPAGPEALFNAPMRPNARANATSTGVSVTIRRAVRNDWRTATTVGTHGARICFYIDTFGGRCSAGWSDSVPSARDGRLDVGQFLVGEVGALARDGVDVVSLCPGLTESEFFEHANVDPSGWPSPLRASIMNAEDVVAAGLKGLGRKSQVVPGLSYRMLMRASRLAPGGLSPWLVDRVMRFALPKS